MTWQIPARAPAPKQTGCPDPVPIQLAAGMDCLSFRLSYRFSQDPQSTTALYRFTRSAHDLATAPKCWRGFLPTTPTSFAKMGSGGVAVGESNR